MIEIRRSQLFIEWLDKLRDPRAVAKIALRIRRMSIGNFGDCEPVGEGVSELRIHYGPGYRVHFVQRGKTILILLCGGDKSTQPKDIAKARTLAREVK